MATKTKAPAKGKTTAAKAKAPAAKAKTAAPSASQQASAPSDGKALRCTVLIHGGSSVGRVLEKLREARAYAVVPGAVNQVSMTTFAVDIDWDQHWDSQVKTALDELKKEKLIEVQKN
jgi:hypothetical protein